MAASETKEEAVEAPIPAEVPLEQLPFVQARLPLITFQPGRNLGAVELKRSQDRTVEPVRRWLVLNDSLPKIRAETMSCLEAAESKGGAVVLRVADRKRFDALQDTIRQHQEEISALEAAMRELDEVHAGLLSELIATRNSLVGIEGQQQAVLKSYAAVALKKGSHAKKPPEKALEDDEIYQSMRQKVEYQIKTANENLQKVLPEIAKIEAILGQVGC